MGKLKIKISGDWTDYLDVAIDDLEDEVRTEIVNQVLKTLAKATSYEVDEPLKIKGDSHD